MARSKFHLDKRNGVFMGVCAGIADHFGWNANYVRAGAVIVTLLGAFPWTLVAYGVAAWLAKPSQTAALGEEYRPARTSTYEMRENMRDIDRRLAEVDSYVASSNSSLANEIEKLR